MTRKNIPAWASRIVPTRVALAASLQWVRNNVNFGQLLEWLIWFGPILLFLFALLPELSPDFFKFLRIAVCFCALVAFVTNFFRSDGKIYWFLIFGAILVVYNPFLRFFFSRDLWVAINIGTAAAFGGNYVQHHWKGGKGDATNDGAK